MQLKTLLPSLLLLALRPEAAFAAPEDAKPTGEPVSFVRASALGVSKRNPWPFALLMQPHYMALPLNNAGSLAKRQSACPATYSDCYEGCCPGKTVCGIYGGEKGCCPTGQTCSGVGGCGKDQVTCSGYCCAEGTTCAKDTNGDPACASGEEDTPDEEEDPGNGCRSGYSPCTIFEGCCPTGSECILPQNCNIPCAADDPPCGPNGCCEKGSVCTEDFTCAVDNSGDFTDLAPTTTATRTSRFITYTTTTEEEPETTEFLDESSTTEESSTETTETSTDDFFGNGDDETTTSTTTTRTVARITVTTTEAGNLAPTMGAMLGNGLGVAAGLLGALVL